MIERLVRHQVEQGLDWQAVVVLIGPRQVGKTTLAQHIGRARGATYLDLENTDDRSLLDDPNHFFETHEDHLVILDEVHRTPEIFQVLRGVIDRGRRKDKGRGRFLILGSASVDLLRQAGESLAGRVRYIEMTPVTALEVAPGRNSRERLWLRGGYPDSLLAETEVESIDVRAEIIRTYLLRDVAIFGPGVSASMMERLWLALAHRQGGVLNASDLARSIDATTREVDRYVDLLVDLFMVRRLQPYAANVGKRLVKSPKIYIRDSGILHALSRVSTITDLVGHPVLGPSWEGFVIENLLSVLPFLHRGFYYRTHVGAEIDLVIEHPDLSTWAIEIKRSQGMRPDKGFHIARQDIKASRSFLVHGGDARFSLGDGVEALGLTDMMEELHAS